MESGIIFEHPVSADLVSFLVQFFPEDTKRDGTDIHYFMPTDEVFCGNIHRLFADADFLKRRKRADGVRRFLKAVATFYGAVDRIDLNKVLCVIGRDVANEFELGEPVTASECFDFNSVPTWANYGAAPAEMRKRLGVSDNVEP